MTNNKRSQGFILNSISNGHQYIVHEIAPHQYEPFVSFAEKMRDIFFFLPVNFFSSNLQTTLMGTEKCHLIGLQILIENCSYIGI